MAAFIINPHGRLQEWVADDLGYFTAAGLDDYELKSHNLLTKETPHAPRVQDQLIDNRDGAYQTYEEGRDGAVSCACHWTVNMAAGADHGRLWGEAYSITPCAIVVPKDSPIEKPADLAGVPIYVGYQSGSHYTTIQALEPFMEQDSIELRFGGNPSERVDQLLAGDAPAITVFGPQLYVVDQLGFRRILDSTFMVAAMIPDGVDLTQVRQYYEGLRRAQADIDRHHQQFVHFYLNELPERHADMVDVRRFGPGERIVFEPYTREMYDSTQSWVAERDIFDGDAANQRPYQEAVATAG